MSIYGNNSLLSSTFSQFSYNPNNLTLVFDTSKEPANNTVSVLLNGSINCTVYWGDGTSDTYIGSSGWKTHTYASGGIYVVQVQGTMTNFSMTTGPATNNNKLKLVACLSFGNSVQRTENAFSNCTNLIRCPSALPLSTSHTSLEGCFSNCVFFNDYRVSNWSVSNVRRFNSMFNGCANFNQPVGRWQLYGRAAMLAEQGEGAAINMNNMFGGCGAFNQSLASWDTSAVTDMGGMFNGASAFNQPLVAWNVSRVVNVLNMFRQASAFAQDLSPWDIRRCRTMTSMMQDAKQWGVENYSAALTAWAAIPDAALQSFSIAEVGRYDVTRSYVRLTPSGLLCDLPASPAGNDPGARLRITGTNTYDGDYFVRARLQLYFYLIDSLPAHGATEFAGTLEVRRSRMLNFGAAPTKYNASAAAARGFLTTEYQWNITDGGQA